METSPHRQTSVEDWLAFLQKRTKGGYQTALCATEARLPKLGVQPLSSFRNRGVHRTKLADSAGVHEQPADALPQILSRLSEAAPRHSRATPCGGAVGCVR